MINRFEIVELKVMKKYCLASWFLFLSLSVGQAWAVNDLLLLPAVKSHKVASSMLMDVTQAGERLVAVGERGHILYSDDNGKSWTQAEVPTSVNLTAVFFPTPEMGWAVGHDSVVLNSRDSGESWAKQLDGSEVNDMTLRAAEALFARKEAELALASKADSDDTVNLEDLEFELEDAQFFLKDAKMAVEEGPTRPFMDVWFKNEQEGLIVGSFGLIFLTENGGETWTSLLNGIENTQGFHYNAITPVNGALLLVGEAGTVYRSADDGRNWERLESMYEGSLFGIVGDPFGDHAVAVGIGGNLVRTSDGGYTWQHEKTPTGTSLSGGTVLSDKTLVIVAQSGEVLLSRDDGSTFTLMNTNFGGCLAVAASGDGHLVLVGFQGVRRVALNETETSEASGQ